MKLNTDYKPSKFNIYFEEEDNLLIFNSVTSSVLLLDKDHKKIFNDFIEDGLQLPKDVEVELRRGNMVVSAELDENEYIRYLRDTYRLT